MLHFLSANLMSTDFVVLLPSFFFYIMQNLTETGMYHSDFKSRPHSPQVVGFVKIHFTLPKASMNKFYKLRVHITEKGNKILFSMIFYSNAI